MWVSPFADGFLWGEIIEKVEKLVVVQLVKNLPVIYVTRKFTVVCTKGSRSMLPKDP
jgi:hypothetical protein